jgi:hypothetical protein
MQRAGLMQEKDNQRDLVCSGGRGRLSRKKEKAGEIPAMIFEMRLQDRAAINLGGAAAGDGGALGIAGANHFANTAAGVFGGYPSDLGMLFEEAGALCKGHRV